MGQGLEFELINRYLTGLGASRQDVVLGVGDDAAIVSSQGERWALALDTLVENVHFPADLPAEWVGYRALAVNLSDLAAMGAMPRWALLGLTLPSVDEVWLAEFSRGLDRVACAYGVSLVGGDITEGALSVSLQITGALSEHALRRDGAQVGDSLWVSGRPGEAAAGLKLWQLGKRELAADQGLLRAFCQPTPRVELGQALIGVATAAIDVSDGLAADAGHLGEESDLAIVFEANACQPSSRLKARMGGADAWRYWLSGGDDYELCFTAPAMADADVRAAAITARTPVRRIGSVQTGSGIWLDEVALDANQAGGYRHFSRSITPPSV
ncbi:MAG: thiamine-phosphate kinase [Spiribacter sp.]|jgi:thiamine-monophosphate kinase|nr:thiamine-phosphate kinase [Spiribacter sp.]MDR9489148.1 thiamine-phosphate kinase [Spiribacter sp.]